MAELFFISKSLALKIHQQQIERFGGLSALRDEALLESALGAAQQTCRCRLYVGIFSE